MTIRKKDLKEGKVFSIQVGNFGYVLAQLRDNCRMDVFDNLRTEDEWKEENLNEAKVLFTIVVADHRLLKLFNSDVTSVVIPNTRKRELVALKMSSNIRKSTNLPTLSLIKHTEVYDPNNIEILIEDLDPEFHKDILYSYEYVGMVGQADKIRDRIFTYFSSRINWDKQKSIFYPELVPPPKDYKKKVWSKE
ncbi:hypothetical protein VIBNISO65_1540027 [Vibrio nigripulchritudo SO65]|uniref:hypothetical protein n=1 Tax=Vibrio nigripulchritudo TaxID=28173 RepID=UPI0003B1E77D|nr:hypothetical protein [Vibrio nigripulchritudo]CCN33791.1 hypothetical protein VIBNIAM115_1270008 [Vibrio nigripulchritudo AM115]CCN44885.1 hypothetical protein VIBNIFTn2_980009 [Vibrio nigripulchritudo FTn2]CCN65692.1 hypothetical protein VIBNIPon4_420027 [Vibrio nigripulchritudo POn4]CCN76257.1 hypothetical protein VIBNISO65_1540027 [Vibrio nigripulchritudo SO65]